jgi:hypothetical protein
MHQAANIRPKHNTKALPRPYQIVIIDEVRQPSPREAKKLRASTRTSQVSVVSPRLPATSRLRPQYQRFEGLVLCDMVFCRFCFGLCTLVCQMFWVCSLSTKRQNSQRAQPSLLFSLRASRTLAPAVTKTTKSSASANR